MDAINSGNPTNACAVAFNTLALEEGNLSPIITEYVHASLTSSNALLGIIGQILEVR